MIAKSRYLNAWSQEAGELLAGGKGEVVTDLVLRPIENALLWAGLDTHVPLRFTASLRTRVRVVRGSVA